MILQLLSATGRNGMDLFRSLTGMDLRTFILSASMGPGRWRVLDPREGTHVDFSHDGDEVRDVRVVMLRPGAHPLDLDDARGRLIAMGADANHGGMMMATIHRTP